MANTVKTDGPFIEISAMDGDWDAGKVLSIESIKFIPGAVNDVVKIFHEVVTGPECCRLLSTDAEPRIEYFHGAEWWPVIDYSECTLNSGHKVVITLKG